MTDTFKGMDKLKANNWGKVTFRLRPANQYTIYINMYVNYPYFYVLKNLEIQEKSIRYITRSAI